MTRPLTKIYNSSRDYSSIPLYEVRNEDDENHFVAAFETPLTFILATCIAALSIADFFIN